MAIGEGESLPSVKIYENAPGPKNALDTSELFAGKNVLFALPGEWLVFRCFLDFFLSINLTCVHSLDSNASQAHSLPADLKVGSKTNALDPLV